MLLPSAFSRPRPAGRPRLEASLFTSPPASPPSEDTSTTLFQTCRTLQSMLQSPQPQLQPSPFFKEPMRSLQEIPEQHRRQLPTPPMRNASLPSPMKLRLRSHSHKSPTSPNSTQEASSLQLPRIRVAKRPPPRGPNKRRREDDEADEEKENDEPEAGANDSEDNGPSTPKRVRIAPETMPLGLERRDFEMLYENHQYASSSGLGICLPAPRRSDASEASNESDVNQAIDWSSEEDRQLVELMLEKLKLSKSDWQDCARSLGKDSGNIKKRWQSLLGAGEVGLKGRARAERSTNSATWR